MKIHLVFLGENLSALPQTVSANEKEIFKDVISTCIKKQYKTQEELNIQNHNISTLSANIPLEKPDLDLSIKRVLEKYGNSFCIQNIIESKKKIAEKGKQKK